MKHLMLSSLFLALASVAHADAGADISKHQALCETEQAKELMGEGGSCRVLVVPQAAQTVSGTCMGGLRTMVCTIKFDSKKEGTKINMNCGAFNQDLNASLSSYKVGALVKSTEGKNDLLEDSKEYFSVSSKMVTIKFNKNEGLIKEPSISINLGFGGLELTNVMCI